MVASSSAVWRREYRTSRERDERLAHGTWVEGSLWCSLRHGESVERREGLTQSARSTLSFPARGDRPLLSLACGGYGPDVDHLVRLDDMILVIQVDCTTAMSHDDTHFGPNAQVAHRFIEDDRTVFFG